MQSSHPFDETQRDREITHTLAKWGSGSRKKTKKDSLQASEWVKCSNDFPPVSTVYTLPLDITFSHQSGLILIYGIVYLSFDFENPFVPNWLPPRRQIYKFPNLVCPYRLHFIFHGSHPFIACRGWHSLIIWPRLRVILRRTNEGFPFNSKASVWNISTLTFAQLWALGVIFLWLWVAPTRSDLSPTIPRISCWSIISWLY